MTLEQFQNLKIGDIVVAKIEVKSDTEVTFKVHKKVQFNQ